jgi:hypothetical protein
MTLTEIWPRADDTYGALWQMPVCLNIAVASAQTRDDRSDVSQCTLEHIVKPAALVNDDASFQHGFRCIALGLRAQRNRWHTSL